MFSSNRGSCNDPLTRPMHARNDDFDQLDLFRDKFWHAASAWQLSIQERDVLLVDFLVRVHNLGFDEGKGKNSLWTKSKGEVCKVQMLETMGSYSALTTAHFCSQSSPTFNLCFRSVCGFLPVKSDQTSIQEDPASKPMGRTRLWSMAFRNCSESRGGHQANSPRQFDRFKFIVLQAFQKSC